MQIGINTETITKVIATIAAPASPINPAPQNPHFQPEILTIKATPINVIAFPSPWLALQIP